MGRYTLVDQARDEKRRQYLKKQEQIVLAKRHALEAEEMKIKLKKRKELEQRHIQRVKEELKKHSREAMAKMNRLRKKQEVRKQPCLMASYSLSHRNWRPVPVSSTR